MAGYRTERLNATQERLPGDETCSPIGLPAAYSCASRRNPNPQRGVGPIRRARVDTPFSDYHHRYLLRKCLARRCLHFPPLSFAFQLFSQARQWETQRIGSLRALQRFLELLQLEIG